MDIDDPVSSLRAAALLTRKLKRRRLSSDTDVPPPANQSKDISSLTDSEDTTQSNGTAESNDKEEGEISEEDAHFTLHSPRSSTPSTQNSFISSPLPATLPNTLLSSWQIPLPARPNLQMTDEQLWEAKVVVLDLLGWGVPPSYLIDFGLSREAVYYVFTELHLKLPDNFFSNNISRHTESSENDTGTLNSATEIRVSVPPSTSALGPEQRAHLLEMEQMRKKELLARKAVMASRRQKIPTNKEPDTLTLDNKTLTHPIDVNGNGQVEVFLQSIKSSERHPPDNSEAKEAQEWPSLQKINKYDRSSVGRERTNETSLRLGKRPVAADFADDFDSEQLAESKSIGVALPTDFLGEENLLGGSTANTIPRVSTSRNDGPTFTKVSVIRKCIIDCSDDEDDTPVDESILSDIALVKAKEEEIRKLRERIERYRLKQLAETETESSTKSREKVKKGLGQEADGLGIEVDIARPNGQLDINAEADMEQIDQNGLKDEGLKEQREGPRYEDYKSLFETYTRLQPLQVSWTTVEKRAGTGEVSAGLVGGSDPLQRVCKNEVPGGGRCVDTGCKDLHLERDARM